jgi:hypothetical protein
LILRAKISANSAPVKLSSLVLIPGKLTTGTMPEMAVGKQTKPSFLLSSDDKAKSLAPKSMLRALT